MIRANKPPSQKQRRAQWAHAKARQRLANAGVIKDDPDDGETAPDQFDIQDEPEQPADGQVK